MNALVARKKRKRVMTKLEEAVFDFYRESIPEHMRDPIQERLFLLSAKFGAQWYQANYSCCCSGCSTCNKAMVTEKQNSEFDDE